MAIDLNKGLKWCEKTCNDPNVGYNDASRRNAVTVNGVTYYDCSSFVNYYLLNSGFTTPEYAPKHNPTWTGVLGAELKRLGWHKVKDSKIKRGDIGLRPGKHTEVCYKGGTGSAIFMGAHYYKSVRQNEVSIDSYKSSKKDFPEIWRYKNGPGSTSTMSFYVAAAIAGNFWVESQINPGVWESLEALPWTYVYTRRNPNRGGFGLGQWTNTGGDSHGRLYKLYRWMRANQYSTASGNGQVKYIRHENHWAKDSSYPSYTSLKKFMTSSSTHVTTLTKVWMYCWEGIHNSTYQQRLNYANRAYTYIKKHYKDKKITRWYSCNGWLSDSQSLNNAVMLYRALDKLYGDGSSDTSDSSGDDGAKHYDTTDTGDTPSLLDELWGLIAALLGQKNKGAAVSIKNLLDRGE